MTIGNIRSIVRGAITSVNPDTAILLQLNQNWTRSPDGKRTPTLGAPVQMTGQLQALSYDDIRHADNMNVQGVRRALYIDGVVEALVRPDRKGGDIVTTPDGRVWLVALVVENWEPWTKCIITLQNGS